MNNKLNQTSKSKERGQSIVEMAFILPLFLAFVFSIIEIGRAWAAKHSLTIAAREGARILVLPYGAGLTYTTEGEVQDAALKSVKESMNGSGTAVTADTQITFVKATPGNDGTFNTADDVVEQNYTGGNRGDRVGVRINHPFDTPLPIILGMFNNGSQTDLPPGGSRIVMGVTIYMDHE